MRSTGHFTSMHQENSPLQLASYQKCKCDHLRVIKAGQCLSEEIFLGPLYGLLFVEMPNTTYVYIYFDKGLLWLHELQVIGMAYE